MKKSFRIKDGLKSLMIYPWRDGWRFAVDSDGVRKYISAAKKEDIKRKAGEIMEAKTTLIWSSVAPARQDFLAKVNSMVAPADESAVLAFLRSRQSSATVAVAANDFIADMRARGRSERHIYALVMDIEAFAQVVQCAVSDVSIVALKKFCDDRAGHCGGSRKKQVRATLVQFFRWCRKQGIIANDALTVADRLPAVTLEAGAKVVITREILDKLFLAIPAKHRAWLALGAWAGLRPEEAAPTRTKLRDGMRGVSWEDIDFKFNIIRISPETSKVDRPRIVPLTPALRSVLLPLRSTGPVCASSPVEDKTLLKLGKDIFDGRWPADCLRHSYGSYRNAILRNLPQVAEEMGTSVDMLHRHYHNPQSKADGKNWFHVPQKFRKKAPSHSVSL
jgi:hypothetical protein